ncbi:hypothetical protein [Marinactinospora thermotolerans]|uniref:hypothetical protein n=1 Tax=Marinactinospora thermotolerans TaxID=531310 RepID=UPI001186A585|nr:hypothetical protein [Marinactinospora thermotolerans]
MSLADREGGSTQEEPGIAPGDSLPKLSTGSASRTEWRGATVEINEIKRSSTGSYASLTWTLINESDSTINLGEMRNRTYYYKGSHDGSGVVLIDEENSLRHNPFIDSQGKCLCAGSEHAPLKFELLTEPGESTTYWASYQLSEDTETVTVEIPGFLPIKDVPVG